MQVRFWAAILVGVVITSTHLSLVDDYLDHHPQERQQINQLAWFDSPTLTLLLIAPLYWLTLGICSALLGILWTKLKSRR